MSKVLAIANCRVSSDLQLKNKSLSRQRDAVSQAAIRLNVVIPDDGWWSGSVSSKAGTNVKRKDLREMLDYCRKNKNVKYAIFDEYDRFMRSVNEGPYFEVLFQQQGVKVWYASESDEFNGDDAMAKFMRAMSAYRAEGSNEERIRKAINGLTKAIRDGCYPFPPPIGYRRGTKAGVHEIDRATAPLIKKLLIGVATSIMSPSDAVRAFNESEQIRTGRHCSYKLDKLRLILTNPYYAGIVEMNKQVQYRNENGLHEPLITKAQHEALLKIVNGKVKNQKGPRKNGNPKYVLNGELCEKCCDDRLGKLAGFDHTNGKTPKIYERYRCRKCGAYHSMNDLHAQAKNRLDALRLSEPMRKRFIEVMGDTWRQQEESNASEKAAMSNQILGLEKQLDSQAAAIANPANEFIRERLERAYSDKQEALEALKERRENIDKIKAADKERFLGFALGFIDDLSNKYLDLPIEKRQVCKQILFPAGFFVSPAGEVYTPEVSKIYRLQPNKKDLSLLEKSLMVRVRGL